MARGVVLSGIRFGQLCIKSLMDMVKRDVKLLLSDCDIVVHSVRNFEYISS